MTTDRALRGSRSTRPGISPRGAVFAAAVVLLVLTWNPPVLHAEQIVIHRFSSQQPDLQLEEVLYLAAGAALVQAGLTSTRQGDAADYLLEARYTSTSDEVQVQYTLSRAQAPNDVLVDLSVDLRVDGSLDTQVAAAVVRLLQAAAIEPAPSPRARIEGLLPGSPPAVVAGKTESGEPATGTATPTDTAAAASAETPATALTGTAVAASTETAAAAPTGTAPAAPTGTSVAASTGAKAREASVRRFDSSISTAGVMLFGAIAEFLHYGVGGVLSAGVTWPRPSWSLTVGADLSFVRALNDAGVTGGPLSLSTAGPSVQLATGTSAAHRVAAGVSGGLAVIIVEGTGNAMAKTAPYASAAVQTTIPIGANVFLGAEARFLAVFADVLILAAVPALILRIEL